MSCVLEVNDLVKSYSRFSLQHISFTLEEDCITGFIGANGAGKTTAMHTILDLVHKNSGTVRFWGKTMEQNGAQIRDRIGVVFDDGCFYDELTMRQMKSVLAPAYSQWDETAYQRWMDAFSLSPKQVISTLSKGMKMKFALTLALSHHADLLLMDEPTDGLDPLVRREFMEILTAYMKEGGKSVLYSTHITSDLEKTADVLLMIHEGKILFEEDRDAMLDRFRIVKGDAQMLTPETEALFINIRQTDYGFTGLTQSMQQVRRQLPDVLVERPTIEEIMFACVKGGSI